MGINIPGAIVSTVGTGKITVNGTGGSNGGGGVSAIGALSTVDGDLSVTGKGIAGTSTSPGVFVGAFSTTGSGNIFVTGDADGSTGIQIGSLLITNGTGSITAKGTATGTFNGINVVPGAIRSAGDARIEGHVTGSGNGVKAQSTTITSAKSSVYITGTSGSSDGILIMSSTVTASKGIALAGDALNLQSSLTAVSGTVTMNLTQSVTQTAGTIQAKGLRLDGASTFAFTTNNVVNTIAGNFTAALNYSQAIQLTVDSVTSIVPPALPAVLPAATTDNGLTIASDVTLNVTGNNSLIVNNDITKSSGANSTLLLGSAANVLLAPSMPGQIHSTTAAVLNILVDADSDGNSDGAILVQNETINSNGGTIIFSGGSDSSPAGLKAGRATGQSSTEGISVSGFTIEQRRRRYHSERREHVNIGFRHWCRRDGVFVAVCHDGADFSGWNWQQRVVR